VQSEGITSHDDLLVAAPQGRLGQEEAARFCKAVGDRVDQRIRRVLLDLSAVDYMTSSALGVIIALLQKVRSGGGRMAVAAPGERIHLLLEVAGLNQLLALCRSREDAEAQLASEEPEA
jgi:anti-sigma B factor antagonist